MHAGQYGGLVSRPAGVFAQSDVAYIVILVFHRPIHKPIECVAASVETTICPSGSSVDRIERTRRYSVRHPNHAKHQGFADLPADEEPFGRCSYCSGIPSWKVRCAISALKSTMPSIWQSRPRSDGNMAGERTLARQQEATEAN